MGEYCKEHCVIDFKNKIVKTYDDKAYFTYNPVECTYLVEVTIINNNEGTWISGSEVHRCYTTKPIELKNIDGVVPKKYIKKCGTTKLEKLWGSKECEYVEGEYAVKYNNQVTEVFIPNNTFIFKHTIVNK